MFRRTLVAFCPPKPLERTWPIPSLYYHFALLGTWEFQLHFFSPHPSPRFSLPLTFFIGNDQCSVLGRRAAMRSDMSAVNLRIGLAVYQRTFTTHDWCVVKDFHLHTHTHTLTHRRETWGNRNKDLTCVWFQQPSTSWLALKAIVTKHFNKREHKNWSSYIRHRDLSQTFTHKHTHRHIHTQTHTHTHTVVL